MDKKFEITKEDIISFAEDYAKERKIKNIDIASKIGLAPCTLSNAKRDGMSDDLFKRYIEALGGSVETETKVKLNKKTYKL